jgi:long-chain fatty acid transport protein
MHTPKVILAVLLLAPAVALPNGYDVPNVAPRDLALAGSATAAQNDAGATYALSAALARLPGFGLSLNGSMLELTATWTDITGGTLYPSPATTEWNPVPPVALFASYGGTLGGRRAGLGFGMNIPAGGAVKWDEDWAGRGAIITVDRKIFGFYLAGGYELSPQLRLGASLIYYYGTEYLKQGVQPVQGAWGELSTQGGGFAWGLSMEIQPSRDVPLTVAIDFKYHGTVHMTGDGHFQVPPALQGSVQDQGATHDLPYPSVLNFALAWQVSKPVLLTGGFTWTGYSIYQTDTIVGDKGLVIVIPRDYGNGYTFRLGAEWAATERLLVRGGVLRDISGLDPATYTPSLPDASSWAFAGGLGFRITPAWTVSASYFKAIMDTVVAPVGGASLPGSYDINAWIASLGVSYQHPPAK